MSARAVLDSYVSEQDFQQSVIELAELYGWRWWHDNDSRRNRAGLPDLLLVRPPRLLYVELKKQDGRVTRAQQEWLDLLGAVPGVEAQTWRPADWAHIERTLRR